MGLGFRIYNYKGLGFRIVYNHKANKLLNYGTCESDRRARLTKWRSICPLLVAADVVEKELALQMPEWREVSHMRLHPMRTLFYHRVTNNNQNTSSFPAENAQKTDYTQRAQYPLIKEYALNYKGLHNMI